MILTKEKRELLITSYKNDIEYYDYRILSADNDFDRGAFKSAKLKTEIALRSLTADPVNPADCFGPVYLATPVTDIKLPDLLDIPDGLDLSSAMAAINWYEIEIKRLNNIED